MQKNLFRSLADFQTVRRGYLQRGTAEKLPGINQERQQRTGRGKRTGATIRSKSQPAAAESGPGKHRSISGEDPGSNPEEKGPEDMSEKTTGKKKREKRPRVLLDVSTYPKDDKGRAIVPDEFMSEHYRELPDGTTNESGTKRVYSGGMLSILGTDPERDREIQKAGGEALQATLKQRKTLAESIEIALRQKATKEVLEALNLPEGSSNQEAITAAIILQASSGNTKAFTALRDTIGEMPTAKTEITADIMTAADRALIEKLQKRIDG